jgi:hypothetical protein
MSFKIDITSGALGGAVVAGALFCHGYLCTAAAPSSSDSSGALGKPEDTLAHALPHVPSAHEVEQAKWVMKLHECAKEASVQGIHDAAVGAAKLDHKAIHKFERSVFKRVAKIAKGVTHNDHPIILATHIWLEATDKRHRYSSNLFAFYGEWAQQETTDSFFYWLDYGAGKDLQFIVNHKGEKVTRETLESSEVQYCTAEERKQFLVQIEVGRTPFAPSAP